MEKFGQENFGDSLQIRQIRQSFLPPIFSAIRYLLVSTTLYIGVGIGGATGARAPLVYSIVWYQSQVQPLTHTIYFMLSRFSIAEYIKQCASGIFRSGRLGKAYYQR